MNNSKKLEWTLKANAMFSFTSGLSMVLFYKKIGLLMGLTYPIILLWMGLGLIGFGAFVFREGNRTPFSKKMIKSIIVQDWIWVIGSICIIGVQWFAINQTGYLMIGIVALIVAGFAFFQSLFLKKTSP